MKKKIIKNKKVFAIQAILVVAVVVVGILIAMLASSHAEPNSASFVQDQTVEGLYFTRTEYENNTLKVMVENTLDSEYTLKTIDVTFLDSNEEEITTITGYIGESIKVGDRKQLVVQTDIDLSSADSIRYTINKED